MLTDAALEGKTDRLLGPEGERDHREADPGGHGPLAATAGSRSSPPSRSARRRPRRSACSTSPSSPPSSASPTRVRSRASGSAATAATARDALRRPGRPARRRRRRRVLETCEGPLRRPLGVSLRQWRTRSMRSCRRRSGSSTARSRRWIAEGATLSGSCIAVWERDGDGIVGWVGSRPTPFRRAHLEADAVGLLLLLGPRPQRRGRRVRGRPDRGRRRSPRRLAAPVGRSRADGLRPLADLAGRAVEGAGERDHEHRQPIHDRRGEDEDLPPARPV